MPFIELTDVTHTYGGQAGGSATLAVEGLTIKVNEGEFSAVVGPSGCGKSTLMKLATGLQFPQKGAVIVDGAKVARAAGDGSKARGNRSVRGTHRDDGEQPQREDGEHERAVHRGARYPRSTTPRQPDRALAAPNA